MKDYLFNYLLKTTNTSYTIKDCHYKLLSGECKSLKFIIVFITYEIIKHCFITMIIKVFK